MISSQEALVKLLRLIRMLETGKTMKGLVEALEADKRTVHRYLVTVRAAGLDYKLDAAKRYTLVNIQGDFSIKLKTEERNYLIDLLILHGSQLSHSENILKKIDALIQRSRTFDQKPGNPLLDYVKTLESALLYNKKVEVDYLSGSNGTIEKRNIEPIRFTEGLKYLLVYSPERNRFENLKTNRLRGAKQLEVSCSRKTGSDEGVDVFHMTYNGNRESVELHLTYIAWRVLVEENPESHAAIFDTTDTAYPKGLRCEVANFLPLGRFILGFPGQVKVIENAALRKYLKEKRSQENE